MSSSSSSFRLLRYQVFLVYGAAFVAVWRALVHREDEVLEALSAATSPSVRDAVVAARVITWAPLWLLVGLASYALISVLHGVATFRDCPEAAAELEREVREARAELAKRGVLPSS